MPHGRGNYYVRIQRVPRMEKSLGKEATLYKKELRQIVKVPQ